MTSFRSRIIPNVSDCWNTVMFRAVSVHTITNMTIASQLNIVTPLDAFSHIVIHLQVLDRWFSTSSIGKLRSGLEPVKTRGHRGQNDEDLLAKRYVNPLLMSASVPTSSQVVTGIILSFRTPRNKSVFRYVTSADEEC